MKMARRPNPIPSLQLNVALPLDVHTQLTAHLYSDLEGRVPLGAYQRFLVERIREFFGSRRLDLAPYAATEPGAFVVTATPETLAILEKTLRGEISA